MNWLQKAATAASLCSFLSIHNGPYTLYKLSKEIPKLNEYVKLAVRLSGLLFSGCGYLTNCHDRACDLFP